MKIKPNDWQKYILGPELIPRKHLILESHKTKVINNKKFVVEPINVMTTKDSSELFFRTFSFVDKRELQEFKDFIVAHKTTIGNFLLKIDKLENFSQYQIVDDNCDFLNLIELKVLGLNSIKTFESCLLEEISRSSSYRFSKNIDISKFYDSIYSHSLEFIEDDCINKIAGKLDFHTRRINGNMTNGIPTGPITSKIISEIILSAIMIELSIKISDMDFHVHRFADDFTIYYDDETDFIKISKCLAIILSKYKLSINKNKLESNYNYVSGFFKTVKAYEIEEQWNILLDEFKARTQSKTEAINMIKKILLNSIQKISSHKERSAFYKWILKTWNNKKSFDLIKQDTPLLKMFLDFAINYIVITDLGLNIPFAFLEKSVSLLSDSLKKEYINKLIKLYDKTTSQMKKIFIFDFLWNNSCPFEFKQVDVKRMFLSSEFLHLAQLLETKKITFNKEWASEEPTLNHKRLSKEWIIWMYATPEEIAQIKNQDIREYLLFIKNHINFYKPFKY